MFFPEIIFQLRKFSSPSKPLYLVGGAVRDSLLSRPCSDFDLVCAQEPRRIARTFANDANGDFYVLDEERDTCRVLINKAPISNLVVDFAAMQGENILEDLSKRDFTINAMAVDLLDADHVIDPFKGGRDLQEKRLRVVTPAIFADDPLRTLRAVRYAVDLGLKMETGITDLIGSSSNGLQQVSSERKRDELFKIFSGRKVHAALQLLHQFDIIKYIPLIINRDFTQTVTRVRSLEDVLDWLCGNKPHEAQAAFYQSSLLVEMGRFKQDFHEHYLKKNQSRRDRRSLLFLASLVDDVHELEGELRKLALSVEEIRLVCDFKRHAPLMDALVDKGSVPAPVEIYRFFSKTGSTGVDLAAATLAEYVAKIGSEFSQEHWLSLLRLMGTLMQAWFLTPGLITPVPFLNGEFLMQHFSLHPGPLIGELLDQLKEEQVKGSVTNEMEAALWIENRIKGTVK